MLVVSQRQNSNSWASVCCQFTERAHQSGRTVEEVKDVCIWGIHKQDNRRWPRGCRRWSGDGLQKVLLLQGRRTMLLRCSEAVQPYRFLLSPDWLRPKTGKDRKASWVEWTQWMSKLVGLPGLFTFQVFSFQMSVFYFQFSFHFHKCSGLSLYILYS